MSHTNSELKCGKQEEAKEKHTHKPDVYTFVFERENFKHEAKLTGKTLSGRL